jgi:hypothetical protein
MDPTTTQNTLCNNPNDDNLLRWRIYTLDRGVIHDWALAYNTTTDATAADAGNQGTNPNPDPSPVNTQDTEALAKQILANSKITYDGNSSCGEPVQEPFTQVSEGQLAITDHYDSSDTCIGHGATDVNPRTLALIAYLGQSHSIDITAFTTGRHDTEGTENTHAETHAAGAAVDIGVADGVSLDPSDSGAGLNEATLLIEAGVDFAQANSYPVMDANINSSGVLPSSLISYANARGVTLNSYSDSPNHLHIDIPWAQ